MVVQGRARLLLSTISDPGREDFVHTHGFAVNHLNETLRMRVPKCTEWMQTTNVVSSRFMCWGLGELSWFDSTNWRPLFPRRGQDGCGGCGGVVLVMVVLMVVLVKKMTLVPTDDDPCFAYTAHFSHMTLYFCANRSIYKHTNSHQIYYL